MTFDLDNAPKAERKAEPAKKKEKKGDKAADAPAEAAKEAPAAAEGKTEGKPAKEKKEKKKDAGDAKKGGKATAAPAEDAGEPVPSMIDLRVGHIVDSERSNCVYVYILVHIIFLVKKHPDADGLYIEVRTSTFVVKSSKG